MQRHDALDGLTHHEVERPLEDLGPGAPFIDTPMEYNGLHLDFKWNIS